MISLHFAAWWIPLIISIIAGAFGYRASRETWDFGLTFFCISLPIILVVWLIWALAKLAGLY